MKFVPISFVLCSLLSWKEKVGGSVLIQQSQAGVNNHSVEPGSLDWNAPGQPDLGIDIEDIARKVRRES